MSWSSLPLHILKSKIIKIIKKPANLGQTNHQTQKIKQLGNSVTHVTSELMVPTVLIFCFIIWLSNNNQTCAPSLLKISSNQARLITTLARPWKAQRKERLCTGTSNSTTLGKANPGHGLPPGTLCLPWDSAPVSTSRVRICFPTSGWVWATDMLILRSEGIHPDETDHERVRSSEDPPRTAALSPLTLQLKAPQPGTMPPLPLSH